MKERLAQEIEKVLGIDQVEVTWQERPQFGDVSTSVALRVAKEQGRHPQEVAEELKDKLEAADIKEIAKITLAGPGFINLWLHESVLLAATKETVPAGVTDTVLVEYTNPNPFKKFHIGHLMSNAIGECISRLIESTGATVKRANYQGDIGLHVAKAVWGMKHFGNLPAASDSLDRRIEFVNNAYVEGATQYEVDPEVKTEIDQINVRLYEGGDEELRNLYKAGREWSLDKFEELYKLLGTKFDYYFFESEVWKTGNDLVKAHTGSVFKKSEGAVVFPGEEYGLHTRVYQTGKGVPTYEAKELGLHAQKKTTLHFDRSIIITASEQDQVIKVGLKALEFVDPETAAKTEHLSHGMMRNTDGTKMSSRTGQVVTGEDLLQEVIETATTKMEGREIGDVDKVSQQIAVAAIKFSILRQAPGKNIAFDREAALSFEGDSGPYLQYTAVRAQSVLDKFGGEVKDSKTAEYDRDQHPEIQQLLHVLAQAVDVVSVAREELAPQKIAAYLLKVASNYNSFYAAERILDESDEDLKQLKLLLTKDTIRTITDGLWLLGIEVPKQM